jgi:hypothetical protein
MADKRARTFRCSFCGKNQDQVRRLIADPGGVYICNQCVDLCREIIEGEQGILTQGPGAPSTTLPITLPSHVVSAMQAVLGTPLSTHVVDELVTSLLTQHPPIAAWLEQHLRDGQTAE